MDEEILAVHAITSWIDEYDWNFMSTRKRRRQCIKTDLWNSPWGKMLQDPQVLIPGTRIERLFRRRFRVPHRMFTDVIVPTCKEKNIFGVSKTKSIPIEFKILLSLRILGNIKCITS